MMLKIGDKVKFLNSVGGGRVTGFAGPKVVTIEDDQGFEVPTLITELVKVEEISSRASVAPRTAGSYSDTRPSSRDNRGENSPPVVPKEKEAKPLFASSAAKPASPGGAFFIAFVAQVPTMPLSGEIKAWLINDTSHPILYHISLLTDDGYKSEKSGKLASYSRVPFKGFTHDDLSHFPAFGFQLMPVEKETNELKGALVATVKVNPVKFYKESIYTDNPYFEQRAFVIGIGEDELAAKMKTLLKHDFTVPSEKSEPAGSERLQKRKPQAPDIREIDLHITELVDNTAGLSPAEMLEHQMTTFRREMERAVQDGIRRIVFIHGVGQGTLKNELRRELSSKYKRYDFQDASFREYGYGATMVMLRNQ